MTPSQPTKISYTPEELVERFIRVAVDQAPDPRWHYRIAVHAASKMRPSAGRVAPTPQAPLQSLGLFYREDLGMDLEVIGVLLGREIDPAHWLEMFLEFNRLSVSAMKHLPLPGGIVGDAIGEWTVGGKPYAGRFVALKFGPRLFVVCCRSSREIYEEVAQDFFVGLTQFGPVDQSPGLSAEPVRKASAPSPVPWELVVPGSWEVSPEEHEDGQAGFQASLSPPLPADPPVASCWSPFPGGEAGPAPEPPPPEAYLGKLAVTLVPAALVPTPESAEELAMETFRGAGLEWEDAGFEDEPPQGTAERSRLLVAPARLRGQAGVELRCRVAFTHGLWFVAGVVGPARGVNPFAWMQNKRVLDVVSGSLKFVHSRVE